MTIKKQTSERVTIESGEWNIVGDLLLPETTEPVAVVILLNQAAGNRTVYRELADQLAKYGIGSLRIDLRGHGESTNCGHFLPEEGVSILSGTEHDVAAAHTWIKKDKRLDPNRIGFVGASYSGEMMMQSGRITGYGAAYVALSPGSLSGDSIAAIDRENLPWLLIVTRRDPYLAKIVQELREESQTAEFLELSGTEHATDLLSTKRGLAEHISLWFQYKFVHQKIEIESKEK